MADTEEDIDVDEDDTSKLHMSGYIDTGLDSAQVLIDSIVILANSVTQDLKERALAIDTTSEWAVETIAMHHHHIHTFHKHKSCVGHCGENMISAMTLKDGVIVLSGGRLYANGHGGTLVNMLVNEAVHAKDLEENGLIFGHDFIFDWESEGLPPALYALRNHPFLSNYLGDGSFVPGSRTDIEIPMDIRMLGYSYYHHHDHTIDIPYMINRGSINIITWNEYYSSVPDVYKRYLVI